jgi:hypothetical protein
MKAIQVKFMGATDTLPSRLKAIVEGGHAYCDVLDYEGEIEAQAEKMARLLIANLHWDVVITGSGMLPNGDYVFTVGGAA